MVLGLVDTFLRPILVGRRAKLPDSIVLVSMLGGMAVLGFDGFVVGPIVAAMFIAGWETRAEFKLRPATG
jgi:predicted PurR-regulated permease PerM